MRPEQISVTGVAASGAVPLDIYLTPMEVGVKLVPGAGATVTVQYTLDDLQDPTVTPVWFDVPVAALVGATGVVAGSVKIPMTALRINQTVGATLSRMRVVQMGIR